MNIFALFRPQIILLTLYTLLSLKITDLPTTDPGVTGVAFTQTATQLGGSGSTKVLCIS